MNSHTPSAGVSRCAGFRPGTILELYTEDCFGGLVRTVDDLPSQVCEFPYLNPVTGPFYVEGAEPGDTLAVHFVEIVPARDWAVLLDVPALRRVDRHAWPRRPLTPTADELVWRYDVDVAAGTVRLTQPGAATTASSCRWTRCTVRPESPGRVPRPG
jgi:hypothetical protein